MISMLFVGCNNQDEPSTNDTAFTIIVKSQGGLPIKDVMVKVFKDVEKQSLHWAKETDRDGVVSFKGDSQNSYFAILEKLPNGYDAEETYEINNENIEIILNAKLGDSPNISDVDFTLGSVVNNFTVTSTDGTEYKVSELLKTKKAIVLNFWFMNCQPCKMEFPYLQQAYVDYSDKLEVIAVNSVDGSNDDINKFANENQLTFPFVKMDGGIDFEAYPTTVVIDRYGTICMVHRGSITSKEEFVKIFEYFTADDYKQALIRNISDIK